MVVDAIRSANVEPGAVLVSPRREFKTRPSNMLPPGESDDQRAGRRTQGRRVEGEHRCRHAFVLHRIQPQSANRRRRLRLLQRGEQRPCGRRSLGHGNVERLPRGDRQRPETVPGQAALARPLHDRHAPQSLRRGCRGKSRTCPPAGGRRRPAPWRAVRRGLRRRRGRAGCRSWRRPLGPGRADRPFWIG